MSELIPSLVILVFGLSFVYYVAYKNGDTK
jgi:hypothetical protein